MGFGGISIWQLLIVLAIVILIFGTKKFSNIGKDLGSGIRSFKKGLKDGEDESDKIEEKKSSTTIDAEAKREENDKV